MKKYPKDSYFDWKSNFVVDLYTKGKKKFLGTETLPNKDLTIFQNWSWCYENLLEK